MTIIIPVHYTDYTHKPTRSPAKVALTLIRTISFVQFNLQLGMEREKESYYSWENHFTSLKASLKSKLNGT